jgi:hypothetical protein
LGSVSHIFPQGQPQTLILPPIPPT